MSRQWMPLDNAALIFPAIRRAEWVNVFRVSVTLKEDIDPRTLQRAVDHLKPRFPSVYVRLGSGLFWYFLEEVHAVPRVRQDYAYPLTHMTPSRLQAYLESPEFRAAMRGRKGLLCGGEAFSGDLLRALKNITDAHLYNQYGPSEATVGVSLARLDHCGEISVGSPMETDQYAILASRVGAVFHCAADVRHYASDGGSLDTNVAGTVNAADFALAVGVPFNHVSTLSVSGEYLLRDPEQTAVFTEADFDIGQNWQDNIYVRGKFLAEREVYDRVERGLCGRVFRLGRLVGRDSDGVFQPNPRSNAVYLTFRGVQAVGAIPRSMKKELEWTSEYDLQDEENA